MKRIFFFLLIITISTPGQALNKKNSFGIALGGPFYYLTYPGATLYYSYNREINEDFAITINYSAYPGYTSLQNISLSYYTDTTPMGDMLLSRYVNITYGGIGYYAFNQPVNGFVIGAGEKFIRKKIEYFFDAYYLAAIDPAYTYTGLRFNFTGGIRLRF